MASETTKSLESWLWDAACSTSGKGVPDFGPRFMRPRCSHLRTIAQAAGSTKGALNCGYLKPRLIPVPPIEEQNETAKVFTALDAKEPSHHQKYVTLTALFLPLLHQLMTSQILVSDKSITFETKRQ